MKQVCCKLRPAVRLPGLLLVALSFTLVGPPVAAPAEIIPSSPEVLQIELGKGALVRLDQAAASVFIAEPEIADIQVKSPRLFYVFGVRPGETTLFAIDEVDRVLLNRRVKVTHNLSRLESSLAKLLPRADIKVRSVEGSLVLVGTVQTAADSETARVLASQLIDEEVATVINRLSVMSPSQVNLRVQVSEVRRDVLKQLGINWNTLTTLGDFTFGLVTDNPVSLATSLSRFSGRHTRTLSDGTTTASLFIDALEQEGLLTILAEPNLTALSGETATFLAGGEFPVPVVDGDDVSVEFREFGVSLAFTPTLVGQDRISLRVRPEVSELTTTGQISVPLPGGGSFTIPALTTRRAETTVELGSGQSLMIAGLLQNNTRHDLSKFPWLGDIPILGALFRSDSFTRNETELLIIVTPYVVRPVSTRITTPVDGYVPPNDFQRYIWNRRYVEQLPEILPVPRDRDGATLVGPAGYVLE